MLQGWVIVAIALAYIGLLFLVASYGDRRRITRAGSARLFIYPLSLLHLLDLLRFRRARFTRRL